MQLTHLRPMSFGEILDSAFGLYRRHFVPLFVTALIPMAIAALLGAVIGGTALTSGGAEGNPDRYFAAIFPITALTFIMLIAMYGALTREVAQAWTGAPVSVGDGYRAGFRSFLTILASSVVLAIISFVAIFVVVLALGIVVGIVAAATGAAAGGAESILAAAGVLGAVLAIVSFLGIFLFLASYFAFLPAIVLEGAGPLRALGRSMQLARGARWRVIGILVTTWLIVILPTIGATILTGGMSMITNPGAPPSATTFLVQQAVGGIVGALTYPFMIAAIVLLYFDRRVRSEALDVQMATDALAPIPG
jgi:hypothetical protein